MGEQTYRIEIARAEQAAVLEHLVEALLDRRQFVRLPQRRSKYGEEWLVYTHNWHELLRYRLA